MKKRLLMSLLICVTISGMCENLSPLEEAMQAIESSIDSNQYYPGWQVKAILAETIKGILEMGLMSAEDCKYSLARALAPVLAERDTLREEINVFKMREGGNIFLSILGGFAAGLIVGGIIDPIKNP